VPQKVQVNNRAVSVMMTEAPHCGQFCATRKSINPYCQPLQIYGSSLHPSFSPHWLQNIA